MRRESTLLFNEHNLYAVLENQKEQARKRIGEIPVQSILSKEIDDLVNLLDAELKIEPIQLLEDETSIEQTEVKVDVSHDFHRAIFDRSRPFYIDGLRVSYYVPFTGDAQLFKCQPNTFNMNPPHARIKGKELVFEYDSADRNVVATKASFERDLNNVRQWLGWITQQVEEYNNDLDRRLRQDLTTRKQQVADSQQLINELGFKIRPKAVQPDESNITSSQEVIKKRPRSSKKKPITKHSYDVALSFAGENREYVERVATILRDKGVSVFYDRFEEVDLWGKNLADHFAEVYAKRSRFIVMFVSEHYAAKPWTNHERKHAQDRALQKQEDVILPVRFDDTEVPGLPSTIGYLDIRTMTPEDLAERIIKKLEG
jgi:hypothetical protein